MDRFLVEWLFALGPRVEPTDEQLAAWVRFGFAAMSWLRGQRGTA